MIFVLFNTTLVGDADTELQAHPATAIGIDVEDGGLIVLVVSDVELLKEYVFVTK